MLLAWLAGLLYPACAAVGAQGLARPPLLDMSHLERPASPNTALAAPATMVTKPPADFVTPVYRIPAAQLYAAIRLIATRQQRVFSAAEYPAELQIHWVVRSAAFNFPDLVTAQVIPVGEAASTLLLYSRSVYGYADFGVNRKRITVWLTALDTKLNQPHER